MIRVNDKTFDHHDQFNSSIQARVNGLDSLIREPNPLPNSIDIANVSMSPKFDTRDNIVLYLDSVRGQEIKN